MQFTLYRSKKKPKGKPYRWRLRADNNEIIAQGQAYKNHADCMGAINLMLGSMNARVVDKTVKQEPAGAA